MIPEALATYRIARLVHRDALLKQPRIAVLVWALSPVEGKARHPKIAELIGCMHCLSVWAAVVVLVLNRIPGGRWVTRALAVSAVAGLIVEATAPYQG